MIRKGDELEEDFEKFCEDEEKWIEMKGLTKEEKEEMEQDDGLRSLDYLEEMLEKSEAFFDCNQSLFEEKTIKFTLTNKKNTNFKFV